ncbi:MAG: HPr family phosphocarrier protein [Bacillota bacterium]
MKRLPVTLTNPTGLHLRKARNLTEAAAQFNSDITVTYGERTANAKSIYALLKIGAPHGAEIVLEADGADEDAALACLVEIIRGWVD